MVNHCRVALALDLVGEFTDSHDEHEAVFVRKVLSCELHIEDVLEGLEMTQ
jgi:hypothetical protein